MYTSKQNFYSPVGSPVKGANENSPLSSPLKQPRAPSSLYDQKNSYQPQSREQILGKPIEIIQGKSHKDKNSKYILKYYR